jgi:hypothetical protein
MSARVPIRLRTELAAIAVVEALLEAENATARKADPGIVKRTLDEQIERGAAWDTPQRAGELSAIETVRRSCLAKGNSNG